MSQTKTIGRVGLEWLESRCISPETASRLGVFTARQDRGRVLPDERGNVLAFPFFEHGVVVSEKYRRLPKQGFFQRPGGKRTFWNADVLDDPALHEGRAALTITEGEPDGLTAIDCGFPHTVSVPDGAPELPFGEHPENLSGAVNPVADAHGKFEFLWNNRERLKKIKRFIIATDADVPGQWLAAELVRRLLPSRCMFVEYPDGCNDLNAVRMRHGPEAVAAVLNNAKPYPVHGLYRLNEFPKLSPIISYRTGWAALDTKLRPFLGELMFVLGIPGHGKSALVANLLVNWAEMYGWRSVIFSPEEPTVPLLRDKLRRIRLRSRCYETIAAAADDADAWINEHVLFIASDPQEANELYLDWIIDRATDAVLRDGVRVMVIDPWNEVEQSRERGESQSEYVGRAIRAINRFRHAYGVICIVLIHPTKEVGREGKARSPTPYDADGSAHFYNKADHFLIVHRPDKSNNESVIRVAKVKFENTGEEGNVIMRFDRFSSRFLGDGSEEAERLGQLEAFR